MKVIEDCKKCPYWNDYAGKCEITPARRPCDVRPPRQDKADNKYEVLK